MTPQIIYEDADIIAVNKPAGLVVHGARISESSKKKAKRTTGEKQKTAEPTLVDWLIKKYPEIKTVGDDPATRPGIVHRLDKETSGVMIVARNQRSFERIKKLFQEHKIKKTYHAVVVGRLKPEEGTINKPIGIVNGTLKRSVRSEKMKKEAVTAYRVIETFEAPSVDGRASTFSLVEVKPETGRTHQIRVHMASTGHPVAGDILYGGKHQPKWVARLMLHAVAIELPFANGKVIHFESDNSSYPHFTGQGSAIIKK